VTLIYSSREERYNNAIALRDIIEGGRTARGRLNAKRVPSAGRQRSQSTKIGVLLRRRACGIAKSARTLSLSS